MVLTHEIFEKAKSINGGWNVEQVRTLGFANFEKSWKARALGQEFPDEVIEKFIALKNTHFKNIEALKRRHNPTFLDVPLGTPYKEQYLHPNWQKMRLLVFKRDDFRCINCNSADKILHAHHLKYNKSGFIWEVPTWYIVTLCEDCHSEEHGRNLRISKP